MRVSGHSVILSVCTAVNILLQATPVCSQGWRGRPQAQPTVGASFAAVQEVPAVDQPASGATISKPFRTKFNFAWGDMFNISTVSRCCWISEAVATNNSR
jgi:hypothetical protein